MLVILTEKFHLISKLAKIIYTSILNMCNAWIRKINSKLKVKCLMLCEVINKYNRLNDEYRN